MKRVTLLAEQAEHLGVSVVLTVTWPTDAVAREIVFPRSVVESIEDIPEPLPTEPGTRFWGKAQDHPAEWWFVYLTGQVRYVSSGGFLWSPADAQRNGLVRLPDPDVTG